MAGSTAVAAVAVVARGGQKSGYKPDVRLVSAGVAPLQGEPPQFILWSEPGRCRGSLIWLLLVMH